MPTTHHKNLLKMSASAATLLALVTTGGFNSLYAQDADAGETELEEVVVTGSRIKRDSNLAGSAPVASLSSEQFRISGEVDITELLNDNPALSTSVTAEINELIVRLRPPSRHPSASRSDAMQSYQIQILQFPTMKHKAQLVRLPLKQPTLF